MAALAAALWRQRSGEVVAGDTGRKGEEEKAHRVRRSLGKLKVALAGEGAHVTVLNRSPEMSWASGAVRRRRGRG